jgi:hypothetical protein
VKDTDYHEPGTCRRWCKVHWYYDFYTRSHQPYPVRVRYQTGDQKWVSVWVYCGPPAYYPAKPTPRQWEQMRMNCPHTQLDLLCDMCLRHTFRPKVLR